MDIDWENYGRTQSSRQRQQSAAYHSHSYIEGNTVRKADALPKRRERIEPRREPRRVPQRKPVRMLGISGKGFVFLTMVTCTVLFFAFNYLATQNEVQRVKGQVVSMQSEIADQKEDYETDYQAIVDSVDLSDIYKKATEKLKMVQAESNQIYTYKNRKSDMVKQYADIPQ